MKGAGSAGVGMSPHLDDAVLSCGALLAHLAARHLITVATVFTAAAPPPWSLPARRQLRALGGVDAEAFFAQRRAEDRDVLAGIGVAAVHLGFRDALFRRGRRGPAYPTFRFDAARGRVASCDARLAAEVSARVGEITRASEAGGVFAPLGLGRPLDHPRPPRRPPDYPPGRPRAGQAHPDRLLQRFPLLADGRARAGLRPARGPGPASLAFRAGRECEPDRRIPDPVRRIVP